MCGFGNEELIGDRGQEYIGCQSKTRSGKTCQPWDSQVPHPHSDSKEEYGTVGNNHCRNPGGKRDTIWCYTADPQTPWERCDPIETPVFKSVDDFTTSMQKRLPGRRYKNENKDKAKRRIDAEIVKISAAGVMDIDFSETLHSFEYFERFGLNKTYWAEIQYTILNITYFCNQEPYPEHMLQGQERNRPDRRLATTNDWWTPARENEILPNLTSWTIEEFTKEGMKIQLNFTNPLLVSAYFEKDLLNV